MRRRKANVVMGLLIVGLIIGVIVLVQTFLFGSAEEKAQITESTQNADTRLPDKAGLQAFKVVGYYPSWQPDKITRIRYDALTHINYAFAIPKEDGALRPLDNPQAASAIIAKAHTHGVKVLLAVGGWSYQSVPLEDTFKSATATADKSKVFAENIIAMAKEYGFDGVDIDWEYPRNGEDSARQYAELMRYLSERLKQENMLLTVAVMPGKTVDGAVQAHAAVHTDEVIGDVDWINVMAYDGSDGSRHATYDFAIDCAKYWQDIRKVPSNKIVLGVPFYGRPLAFAYDDILAVDRDAMHKDIAIMEGNLVYYNGGATIRQKTDWALDHIGGIMIWELSQDSADEASSLLNVIGTAVKKRGERSIAK